MAFYLQYNDPLRIIWRSGTIDDPYVDKSDNKMIINGIIILTEIPDEFNRVSISGYSEIHSGTPDSTQFIVNYQNGIVTFNPLNENVTVTASYKGRGVIQYPAERIFARRKDNPDVIQNLQEIIDNHQGAIDVEANLVQLESDVNTAITNAETATTNANNSATYANTEGNYANTQGTYAKDQGGIAKTKGDTAELQGNTAQSQGNTAETQGLTAQSQGNTAQSQGNTAETQGLTAQNQGNTAETQGTYAKNQGDYAKGVGDNLSHKNEYVSTSAYKALNIVWFQGSTYMALQDVPSGTNPNDKTYWKQINTFRWKGTYSSTAIYSYGDAVVDSVNENIYMYKNTTSSSGALLSDTLYWEIFVTVKDAVNNANTSATYANGRGDYANTQGTYAKNQGDYAKTQGDYAKTNGDYALAQGDYANTEGLYANTQGNYALNQGDYAQGRGDYANTQGNYAKSVGDSLQHKGNYSSTATYYIRNIVYSDGITYMCIKDHTGIAVTDTLYWKKLAGMRARGVYSSTSGYMIGDIVTTSDYNKTYMALKDHMSGVALTDTSGWLLLTDVQNAVDNANTSATNANNSATNADNSATNANNSATNADNSASNADTQATYAKNQGDYAKTQGDYAQGRGDYADSVGSSLDHKGDYVSTTTYYKRNMVYYSGSTFMALTTVTGTTPVDDGINWKMIAQKGDGRKTIIGTTQPTDTSALWIDTN